MHKRWCRIYTRTYCLHHSVQIDCMRSAGDLHAETQRRLCTASGHDRIVASITAASCALASAEEASPGSDASDVSAPALLPAETLQLLHTLLVPGECLVPDTIVTCIRSYLNPDQIRSEMIRLGAQSISLAQVADAMRASACLKRTCSCLGATYLYMLRV